MYAVNIPPGVTAAQWVRTSISLPTSSIPARKTSVLNDQNAESNFFISVFPDDLNNRCERNRKYLVFANIQITVITSHSVSCRLCDMFYLMQLPKEATQQKKLSAAQCENRTLLEILYAHTLSYVLNLWQISRLAPLRRSWAAGGMTEEHQRWLRDKKQVLGCSWQTSTD